MSLTREDMLRELELLPAWHLKRPLHHHVQPDALPVAPSVLAVDEALIPAAPTLSEASTQVFAAAGAEEALTNAEATVVDETAAPLTEAPDFEAEHAPAVAPATKRDAEITSVHAPASATPEPVTASDAYTSPPWDDEVPPPDEMLLPIFDDDDHLPAMGTSLGQGRRDSIAQLDWQGLQSCVANCEACSLSRTRTQTVFGVGDPAAEWLIVGEAPGAEEDKRGEPFVGQAGQLLDNMLGAIQLKRGQNVYIANVLKCRPPENRDPQGEEVQQCDPFLKRQVELIKPKLILALGKFAAQSLLNSDATIGSMRGRQHEYNGVPVIVTYHPAYLLRNLMDKAKAWEDLCLARATMRKLQEDALQSAAAPSSKD